MSGREATKKRNSYSGRKSYIRQIPRTWWLKNTGYQQYMLREATSIFVLLFSIELYFALFSLIKGEHAWNAFIANVQSPFMIFQNTVMFAAIVWHLITWFKLTPQTMPLRVKGKAVEPRFIVIAHYSVLAIASALILLILGGVL